MKAHHLLSLFCCLAMSGYGQEAAPAPAAPAEPKPAEDPVVLLKTTMGDIKIRLNAAKAPITVENFLKYVDEGFYSGTIFHRVIGTFMIQGGGFDKNMSQKATHASIKNEANNGLKNDRGTIAMARTSDINSATAQFFINVVNNDFLNFRAPNPQGFGYCVFGEVVEGMDTVDKIRAARTGVKNGMGDVPVETIEILSASRVTPAAGEEQAP